MTDPIAMRGWMVVIPLALHAACSPPTGMTDAGRPPNDIFVRAAEHVPGGSFLGVYLPPAGRVNVTTPAAGDYDRVAYLVRGFVGVDPHTLDPAQSAGSLVGYRGDGTFDTLCTFDRVARAVVAVDGVIIVVGDGGLLARYAPTTHACTVTTVTDTNGATCDFHGIASDGALSFAAGRETVAGIASPCVVRVSGDQQAAETLPASSATVLTSVSFDPAVGFWAVGDNGVTMQRPPLASAWTTDSTSETAAPLHAVSTESTSTRRWTMVVGGDSENVVLVRNVTQTSWTNRHDFPRSPNLLRSVYTRTDFEVYEIGTGGLNVVYNGRDYYIPPGAPVTTQDLLAVHGSGGIVIAAGGDPSNATPSQSGVVLIRGETTRRMTFTVDGVTYPALGNTRLEFGLGSGSAQ